MQDLALIPVVVHNQIKAYANSTNPSLSYSGFLPLKADFNHSWLRNCTGF